MKKNIINSIVILFVAAVIFGFVYTSSNKATVRIEPIKKAINNNEIAKSHSLITTKAKNQEKNKKNLKFPCTKDKAAFFVMKVLSPSGNIILK